MQAVAVRKFKDPAELMDLPKPTPAEGEILVRLSAAGVNPFDWKIADGVAETDRPHVFPLILGVDGAGVVEEVGAGTKRFAVGDGVYGSFLHSPVGIGTYAQYVVAPETLGIAQIPRGVPSAQAAAVPTAGMMALQILDTLGLARGQNVLIIGAAGGVGSFAIQLGDGAGLHVIAAARVPNRNYLIKLGATETFDAASVSFLDDVRQSHPSGVDALVDLGNQGDAFLRNLVMVRPNGVVVSSIGAVDAAAVGALGLRGMNVDLHPSPALLDRLSSEISQGRMRVPVESQVSLSDAVDALNVIREGKGRGKTVLTI
ncbi:MAG TPA: NADP-dependent oxidoreductase [Thermoplasmata archaeon]